MAHPYSHLTTCQYWTDSISYWCSLSVLILSSNWALHILTHLRTKYQYRTDSFRIDLSSILIIRSSGHRTSLLILEQSIIIELDYSHIDVVSQFNIDNLFQLGFAHHYSSLNNESVHVWKNSFSRPLINPMDTLSQSNAYSSGSLIWFKPVSLLPVE